MERELIIHELRKQGFTLQKIGDIFGLSRERIRQINNKNKKPILKFSGYLIKRCVQCKKDYKHKNSDKGHLLFCSQVCRNNFNKNLPEKCRICGSKKDLIENHKGGVKKYFICSSCNTKRYKKSRIDNPNVMKSIRKSVKKYALKNKKKVRVWASFNQYIKYHKIKRPKICSKCHKRKKVDAHHQNYNNCRKVRWLCRKCHIRLHKNGK